MTEYTLGKASDFYPGVLRAFELDGSQIAVVQVNGELYAFSNRCTHSNADLTDGQIEGSEVICWWHGSVYSVLTGEVVLGPATEPLTTYRIHVKDGSVQLYVPD